MLAYRLTIAFMLQKQHLNRDTVSIWPSKWHRHLNSFNVVVEMNLILSSKNYQVKLHPLLPDKEGLF